MHDACTRSRVPGLWRVRMGMRMDCSMHVLGVHTGVMPAVQHSACCCIPRVYQHQSAAMASARPCQPSPMPPLTRCSRCGFSLGKEVETTRFRSGTSGVRIRTSLVWACNSGSLPLLSQLQVAYWLETTRMRSQAQHLLQCCCKSPISFHLCFTAGLLAGNRQDALAADGQPAGRAAAG